ncbi:hypothetical protein AB1K70_10630 [Bremerella sp. JC770]|uniref:hypothetical protein n=1 Tax=Bremerella sp. JC770 TaxID=3232137 RepID=UPI00345A5D13
MTIDLKIGEQEKLQCVEAGFATMEEYLYSLLAQDRERLAILKGLADVEAGRVRPFKEFDAEFRKQNGINSAD